MVALICSIIIGVQLLSAIALSLIIYFTKNKELKNQIVNKGISIIIPYHNEEYRIKGLVDSLNNAQIKGSFEFIFVNDYTNDNTTSFLVDNLSIPFKMLGNKGDKGKKNAVRIGVNAAKYDYILTWDADIEFDSDYLLNLKKLPIADLVVLPVQIMGKSIGGKLSVIEFDFLRSLNEAIGSISSPILCNGANLFFKKKAFIKAENIRNDYNIKSGDDLFLMQAILKNNGIIKVWTEETLIVRTNAPETRKSRLQQGQRWFGKMKHLLSAKVIAALLLLIAVQCAFIGILTLGFFNPLYLLLLIPKYISERLITNTFFKEYQNAWWLLFLHQIWYPINAIIRIFPVEKEQKWK